MNSNSSGMSRDDALVLELGAMSGLQFGTVAPFHHEDEVGPFDQFGGEWIVSIVVRAGRIHFDVERFEKTCSAVGRRRRFWLHTNRTRFTLSAAYQYPGEEDEKAADRHLEGGAQEWRVHVFPADPGNRR